MVLQRKPNRVVIPRIARFAARTGNSDARLPVPIDLRSCATQIAGWQPLPALPGRKLFALQPQTDNFSGIEIWQGASLLYSDQCHAHDTGRPAPIVSPFETSESTMFLTWRPCVVRPLLTTASAVMGEISSAGGTTSSAEGPGTAEHRLLPSASERAA
jgi:hypothetical protein